MRVDERDYLIVRDEKDKKFLAKLVDTDPLRAIVCDENQKNKDRAVYVDFELKDIVANLGKKPTYGDAYRVPVEYVRQEISLEPWGSIRFYKELSEDQFKKVIRSVRKVTATLEEHRVFPREKPIHLLIKDLKGIEGGHYKHYFSDKKDDDLVVRATEFQEIDYVLTHELSHGCWFMLCDDSVKAKWIKAYYLNKSLIDDAEKKYKQMRQELIDAGTIKDYRKQLDDDDTKDIFDAIIKQFREKYAIDSYDINSLVADGDDLTEIWPTKAIEITKDAGVLVSEYANKNPKELFAECFAYYFDESKQLPKSMHRLMSKTIEAIRYGRNTPKGKLLEDAD